MITSLRTVALLWTLTLLSMLSFFQAASAASPSRRQAASSASGSAKATHFVVRQRPRGNVSQAADRSVRDANRVRGGASGPLQPSSDPPLPPGASQVQQASHLYANDCGPVCDCSDCASEASCGVEVGYGEVACGIDAMPMAEPVCGFEVRRHLEVGCGLGEAIDRLTPWFGRRCGVAGCTDCYEATCGLEMEQACGVDEVWGEGPGCGLESPGILMDDPACGVDSLGHCGCDACTSAAEIDAIPVFFPLLRIDWHRYDFFAGTQGFKGPLNFANTDSTSGDDRVGSGSFGFYQGFNHGRALDKWFGWDLSGQFGLRATQNNLSGTEFSHETRNQIFLTGGLFRRVDYGLQYGLAVDYLNEDWYYQNDLVQLRGEFSWRNNTCHVWGFQFMAGVSDDTATTSVRDGNNVVNSSTIEMEPTDQYRLFYRRLLRHNGEWNAFAGWTDRDDGILGADLSMPLRPRLALATGVTYLIPKEGDGRGGNEEESWNLSLGLVFRPGGHNGAGRYNRPMFRVADNGTFLVDRQ